MSELTLDSLYAERQLWLDFLNEADSEIERSRINVKLDSISTAIRNLKGEQQCP